MAHHTAIAPATKPAPTAPKGLSSFAAARLRNMLLFQLDQVRPLLDPLVRETGDIRFRVAFERARGFLRGKVSHRQFGAGIDDLLIAHLDARDLLGERRCRELGVDTFAMACALELPRRELRRWGRTVALHLGAKPPARRVPSASVNDTNTTACSASSGTTRTTQEAVR